MMKDKPSFLNPAKQFGFKNAKGPLRIVIPCLPTSIPCPFKIPTCLETKPPPDCIIIIAEEFIFPPTGAGFISLCQSHIASLSASVTLHSPFDLPSSYFIHSEVISAPTALLVYISVYSCNQQYIFQWKWIFMQRCEM